MNRMRLEQAYIPIISANVFPCEDQTVMIISNLAFIIQLLLIHTGLMKGK